MTDTLEQQKRKACIAEGWEVRDNNVWAFNESFPLAMPLSIYLKVYRTNPSAETRYEAMYKAFTILWPERVKTYNYWMERMFREHVNHESEFISLAAGGGIGKTETMSMVAVIFWLALPHKRAVVVTSTTIASLKKRIYGFILRALNEAMPHIGNLKLHIVNTPTPIISISPPDFIHGIFGIAAKEGPEEKAIKDIIGHHPKNAMLLILDEAPDMPIPILNAIPNLKKALEDRFQAVAIGNANSVLDLHGIASTPEVGWENINPKEISRWKTTQPNGVCLYFNPYDSPAIHETDPEKKKLLSKFLMTEEKLIAAERDEGVDSDSFWRMTMGYWRQTSMDKNIVTKEFLKDYDPTGRAEFSGLHELVYCAGLDPAFSTGGDKCLLRLGILGHHVNGKVVLDFRGTTLLFHIKIKSGTGMSAEIQIANQVIALLSEYRIPLNTLCIDASGQGRGLADVIQLQSRTMMTPTKIYSTNQGNHSKKKEDQLDLFITSPYEMWSKGKEFITHRQIFGLDPLAYGQLHNRLFIDSPGGKKTLEKKADYRTRMGRITGVLGGSPDEADSAMLCLQSAILHHGFSPGQQREIVKYADDDSKHFDQALKAYQAQFNMTTKPFNLKATYGKGIGSILRKPAF